MQGIEKPNFLDPCANAADSFKASFWPSLAKLHVRRSMCTNIRDTTMPRGRCSSALIGAVHTGLKLFVTVCTALTLKPCQRMRRRILLSLNTLTVPLLWNRQMRTANCRVTPDIHSSRCDYGFFCIGFVWLIVCPHAHGNFS